MAHKGTLSREKHISGKPREKKPDLEAGSMPEGFSELWQVAFDASPDMISILDNRHRIVSVNRSMAEAMQTTPSAARGKFCFQLLHRQDRPPIACPHRALLEDGKGHQTEVYEERLNKWLLVSVVPLFAEDGQLMGGIHIARDITRQKQVEQALRESEERLRHLSEATVEGVLLSHGSRIVAANRVLCEMMGYSMETLRGMNLLRFIAPEDRRRLVKYLRTGGTGVHKFLCIRKDKTVFPVEIHSKVVAYQGRMVFQTAVRDLTRQKREEEQRLIHGKTLGMLELAGAIGHEFNQPLMALQGYIDIVQKKFAGNEAISLYLDKMRQQIQRLSGLTRKLGHITQYQTKHYAGGETIIDINRAASKGS
jgi:PAS domain S-box-containing protein